MSVHCQQPKLDGVLQDYEAKETGCSVAAELYCDFIAVASWLMHVNLQAHKHQLWLLGMFDGCLIHIMLLRAVNSSAC